MKHPVPTSECIVGTVERVTFHSPASGFCVLRVKARGQRDPVTVIGNAATINAGEMIEGTGVWVNDRQHGLQFKAERLIVVPPTTLEGIKKYLASGMIRGIGPHFASKLIDKFADRVFDVIEHHPERLLELEGIGTKRQEQICAAWVEQKVIRAIMIFLQSHGVGSARAVRIYKTYGDQAIDKVREDPYRLALDIHGIGFKTADTLAARLGIPPDSPLRARAGVRHVLQMVAAEGHCAARRITLIERAMTLLDVPESVVSRAIEDELAAERLIPESIDNELHYYLAALYRAECAIAQRLQALLQRQSPWQYISPDEALTWVQTHTGLTLSTSQCQAVRLAINSKVTIVTGGPGVGKTTVVNSILKILHARNLRIILAAPTGRAAKRLSESTGLEAKTIHRLLEFDPKSFDFKRNAERPLEGDVIVVDEVSMVDVVLMHQFLRAVPLKAGLLIVGDVDQLPSVGPGTVLSDLIASNAVPCVCLTEIFRQTEASKIVVNAHRINRGMMPLPMSSGDQLSDFYFIPARSPEEIFDKLMQVVLERIPRRFSLDPLKDIQVLTPMNRGGLGSRSLNIELQARLNRSVEASVERFGWRFLCGDKIVQIVNNYDKEVYNGDVGTVVGIDHEDGVLSASFDGRVVLYEFGELDELSLAYALTIHKSQGSEYPAVVIPLAMQHYNLLERNLLYTGVTRARKLLIVIGQKKALGISVTTARATRRITHLANRIRRTLGRG